MPGNRSYEVLQDTPSPPGVAYIWLMMLVLSIVVICGNAYALSVLLRATSNSTKSLHNMFIFHLIGNDLTRGVLAMIWTFYNVLQPHPGDTPVVCQGLAFLLHITMVSSGIPLLLLLLDRLIFVQSPINYSHRMTQCFIIFLMVYNIIHGLIPALLPFTAWGKYGFLATAAACDVVISQSYGYTAFVTTWGYILPMIGILLVYYQIHSTVKHSMGRVWVGTSKLVPTGQRAALKQTLVTHQDRTLVKMLRVLSAMVVFYMVSWIPYSCLLLLSAILQPDTFPGVALILLKTLTLLCSAINPWIYGVYNQRFRTPLRSRGSDQQQPQAPDPTATRSVSMVALQDNPMHSRA